jgi:dGTP triphosphohydrolase
MDDICDKKAKLKFSCMTSTARKSKAVAVKAKQKFQKVQKKEVSLSDLKKRIRSTQRMLAKVDASGNNRITKVKVEMLRKIEALKDQVEITKTLEVEEKLASKYKYVKFVETKKITKKLKNETDPIEKKKLEDQVCFNLVCFNRILIHDEICLLWFSIICLNIN